MLRIPVFLLLALIFSAKSFASCDNNHFANQANQATTNLDRMICSPGEFKQIFLEILKIEKEDGAKIRLSSIAFIAKTKTLKGLQIKYGPLGKGKSYTRLFVDEGEVPGISEFLQRAMIFSSSDPSANNLLSSNMRYGSKGGLIIQAEKGNLGSIILQLKNSNAIDLTIQESQKFSDTFKAMSRTFRNAKKVKKIKKKKK